MATMIPMEFEKDSELPQWRRTVAERSKTVVERSRLFALFLVQRCYLPYILTVMVAIWALSFFPEVRNLAASISHGSLQPSIPERLPHIVRNDSLHLLLPATDTNEHLCKVILSSTLLGYNSPVILGWGAEAVEGIQHGGSHALKISRTLKYLKSLRPENDDDLVILVDAYDIHFQLPPAVMIDRYYKVTEAANRRIEAELGSKAYNAEGIREKVVIAAAKRNWPNPLNEVSTWTAPKTPAPEDTYGGNTDTIIGHNEYYSQRQRFLNSGVVIGPARDMRKIFQRAEERIQTTVEYHDSDQSVFAIIMGEQNYNREVLRLKHVSWWKKLLKPKTALKPRDNTVYSLYIDNILNPAITHIPYTPDPNAEHEFGVGLDYMLDFAHQTSNSEIGRDSAWIKYATASSDIVKISKGRDVNFDCKVRAQTTLPDDIASLTSKPYEVLLDDPSASVYSNRTWYDVPLYTHLCYGTIPLMIHHNGEKKNREKTWPDVWLQKHAKEMLQANMKPYNMTLTQASEEVGPEAWDSFRAKPSVIAPGGAWTGFGNWLDWKDICPSSYDKELFRAY